MRTLGEVADIIPIMPAPGPPVFNWIDTFRGDGSTTTFRLSRPVFDGLVDAFINSEPCDYAVTVSGDFFIHFSDPPPDNSVIRAQYLTEDCP